MEELQNITAKYTADYLEEGLASLEALKSFALTFYKDVAEIYDCLTRIKNIERNPTGFSIDDASILGLLVKVWKLLKEVIRFYELDNAEMISIFERPLTEAAITARYLMAKSPEVILDYRKCSFKDRLRILRDLENGSPFYETKPGQRLLESVRRKLKIEGFTKNDFEEQKRNRWKLQGKTFYDIFAEIEHPDLYACTYGMMSEPIHGSWSESLDWCLVANPDGTFQANPFSYPADILFVTPTLKFINEAYRLWLKRIDVYEKYTENILNWIEKINSKLYFRFDELFEEN